MNSKKSAGQVPARTAAKKKKRATTSNEELTKLNDDQSHLFSSVNLPILMLDRALRVRRFTPQAEKVLSLSATDLGRPIGDIRLKLNCPDLEQLIAQVTETLNVEEREVQDAAGRWYLMHVQPYLTLDNKIDGAVLMLVDIDALKRNEAEIRQARDYAEAITRADVASAQIAAIVESSDDAIVSKDLNGIITSWNRGAEKLFGYTAEEIIGKPVSLLIPLDRTDEEPKILERLRRGERIDHYETVRQRKDGRKIDISLTVSPMRDKTGKVIGASKIARDITERKRAEEARRETEARLSAIVHGTYEFIGLLSPAGTVLEANRAALEWIGCTRDEVINRPFWETPWWTYTPGAAEQVREAIQLAASGEFIRQEVSLCNPKGELIVFDFSLYPICDEQGQVVLLVPEGRDISERKQAELLLDAQKQSLEMVAKGVPLAEILTYLTLVVEQQSGGHALAAILLLNEEGRLHNGAAPSLPEEYISAINGLKADPNVGTCSAAAAHNKVIITPDIETDPAWQELKQLPLALGLRAAWSMPIVARAGHVLGTFGTYFRESREPNAFERQMVEILARIAALAIERDRLQEQLGLERARLEYIFEQAPAFVALLRGPEHVFELVNPAFLQLVGQRELLGKKAHEALPEVAGQGFFELLDNVYQTGKSYTDREMRILLQREPGAPLEERFLDFVFQPFAEAAGAISVIFAHGVDVTEQVRQRQALEVASRLKDDFLATVSHELRAPLNAMLGWTKMLKGSNLSAEKAQSAIETIERNAYLQAQLIEDLLDVSRIVSGNLRLDVRPVDLAQIIKNALEVVRPAAEAKGVELLSVLDEGVGKISGDASRLQQVIWNLLSNAVKFTPRGGHLQVRLELIESHLQVVVSDTGQGITSQFLPFVFERFRQADGSTTRSSGGLGLGLAIVKTLVELHGGSVRADSEGAGKGASFTVSLPLLAVVARSETEHKHPRVSVQNHQLSDAPNLSGIKVLIVDDEPDTRVLLREILEECGAEVRDAGSAEAGLL